jgi:hypothetical protein
MEEVGMSTVKLTVPGTGTGTCALTGKEGAEGLTVCFEGEPQCFVSWRAFKQLLSFKTAQGTTPRPVAPVGNGSPAVK